VFGTNHSEGMKKEIKLAKALKTKIVYHDSEGNLINL